MGPSAVAKITSLVITGLLLALFGLLMYLFFPRILQWQVEENLVLTPNAEPYEYWREVPVPIYCKFYFFNITNAYAIEHLGAKPVLQEHGPYAFREEREKINITWHDNGTVSYYQLKRWFFDPNTTVGSLDDMITTVNVPMVTAANKARSYNDEFFTSAIEALLTHLNSTVFITQPVGKLLFEGYSEKILVTVKNMGIEVPYEKFGWFYPKNNSHDGLYTIYTGQKNVDNYGLVEKWNGKSFLSGRIAPCNQISGTAGDMWPPFRHSKDDKLQLFVADICSSLKLSFLTEVEINDIGSYRYWLDETTFDNGKQNMLNKCYCKNTCIPSGALDIEECQHGAPAIVSFPHYLYADSQYRQKIDGMKPDPEIHKFIIDLEPKLGIPINVEAKLQINVAVPKMDDVKQLEFPEETIYYPIFWFSESASVNLETAEKLKFVTKSLPQYVAVGCFLSVITGGIILTLTLHYAIRRRHKKPKSHMVYTPVLVVA